MAISKMIAVNIIPVFVYGMLALVLLISAAVFWRFMSWKFSVLNKIPGPIKDLTFKSWLSGVFFEIETEDFMEPHKRWWKEAGEDTKLIYYSGLFGKQFVMVLDADGIKKILTSPAHEDDPPFPKGFKYIRRFLGDGLVTLEGASWHRHRRIIQPAFGINIVKTGIDATVPNLVYQMIDCWKANPGSDIDISSHMAALTLDVIGKVAFSHEFDAMKSVQQWSKDTTRAVELKNPLIDGLHSCLTPSLVRMLLFNLKLSFLERFFLPKLYKSGVLFDEATDAVVKNAQTQSQQNDGTKSLLEFMCKPSSHGSFTRRELRNEAKTFLIAGHETTSTLCTWAIYCMTKYVDVQKLIFDEILSTHGLEGDMNVDSVDKLEYLECFLKEVLRMYPPVGLTLRLTPKGCTLLGDKIPANTKFILPAYLLHRHPKYWTDPLEFKPERWSKTAEKDPKFHHFAYFPFSAGGRVCIGQRFSMYEAKLILAMLVRDFEFSLSPSLEGVELKLSSFITMHSTPPITIRAKCRRG